MICCCESWNVDSRLQIRLWMFFLPFADTFRDVFVVVWKLRFLNVFCCRLQIIFYECFCCRLKITFFKLFFCRLQIRLWMFFVFVWKLLFSKRFCCRLQIRLRGGMEKWKTAWILQGGNVCVYTYIHTYIHTWKNGKRHGYCKEVMCV